MPLSTKRKSEGELPFEAFRTRNSPGALDRIPGLSEVRDWIGFLDRAFSLKKRLVFLNRKHEEWLAGLSMKANKADARSIPDAQVKIPVRFRDQQT